jgi:hypothetical protein
MPWCYEIRGAENRLVETRSGFATEEKAVEAGERAKRMIGSVCYSSLETLTLVTKQDQALTGDSTVSGAPEGEAEANGTPKHGWNLRYPWQQAVLDAFLESHRENLSRRINVAERAISTRLLETDPFKLEERIALGEALLALRRLLREQSRTTEEAADKKSIA